MISNHSMPISIPTNFARENFIKRNEVLNQKIFLLLRKENHSERFKTENESFSGRYASIRNNLNPFFKRINKKIPRKEVLSIFNDQLIGIIKALGEMFSETANQNKML